MFRAADNSSESRPNRQKAPIDPDEEDHQPKKGVDEALYRASHEVWRHVQQRHLEHNKYKGEWSERLRHIGECFGDQMDEARHNAKRFGLLHELSRPMHRSSLVDDAHDQHGRDGADGSQANQSKAVFLRCLSFSDRSHTDAHGHDEGDGHRPRRRAPCIEADSQIYWVCEIGNDEYADIEGNEEVAVGYTQDSPGEAYSHEQADSQTDHHHKKRSRYRRIDGGRLTCQHPYVRLCDRDEEPNGEADGEHQRKVALVDEGCPYFLSHRQHPDIHAQKKDTQPNDDEDTSEKELREHRKANGRYRHFEDEYDDQNRNDGNTSFFEFSQKIHWADAPRCGEIADDKESYLLLLSARCRKMHEHLPTIRNDDGYRQPQGKNKFTVANPPNVAHNKCIIACSFCFGEGRGSETSNKGMILLKKLFNVAIICNIVEH